MHGPQSRYLPPGVSDYGTLTEITASAHPFFGAAAANDLSFSSAGTASAPGGGAHFLPLTAGSPAAATGAPTAGTGTPTAGTSPAAGGLAGVGASGGHGHGGGGSGGGAGGPGAALPFTGFAAGTAAALGGTMAAAGAGMRRVLRRSRRGSA